MNAERTMSDVGRIMFLAAGGVFAEETEGAKPRDANVDKTGRAIFVRPEIDHLMAFISSGEEIGCFGAVPRTQNPHHPPDLTAVAFQLYLPLESLDFLKPALFLIMGNRVLEFGGRRRRPR